VRFALYLANGAAFADPRLLADLAGEAEASGWDGFFIWDVIALTGDDDEPQPVVDAWVSLAAIAARTERIRIGPMVIPLARRRVQNVARETVTLDHLSGGRLTLGVGLGGPAETEFVAFGEEGGASVRAAKLDESLEALTGLWTGEPFTFEGRHVRLDDVTFSPTPVQEPRIPIWVGGHWPNRGPARRAARFDGMFPIHTEWPKRVLSPQDCADVLTYIGEHRTITSPFDLVFTTTWTGDLPGSEPATVREYEDAGVTWWLQEADEVEQARRWARDGPPRP
jgi:alkanesulfonate monooxygenase SsuD/methylene tetrahydromethanopterin reductase-like flavin-dependent oxidoreductase (luciferase family)